MATPRVAVGIINYGDYRHLPVCLDSVKRQSLTPDLVMVLDNQSRAEEMGPIASAYPEVRLLSMRENLGYGGGADRRGILDPDRGLAHAHAPRPLQGPRSLQLTATEPERAKRVLVRRLEQLGFHVTLAAKEAA